MQRLNPKHALLVLILTVVAGLGTDQSALAHGLKLDTTTVKRVITTVGLQSAMVSQICADLAMIASGKDVASRRARIAKARRFMTQSVKGLRRGDSKLGLPITKKAEILKSIAQMEDEWAAMDSVLKSALAKKSMTADDVAEAIRWHHRLRPIIEQVSEGYLRDPSLGLYSMLSLTLRASAQKRALGQQMFNEFVLVALGHEVEAHQSGLRGTMVDFDVLLRGLSVGNPEIKVLPSPTPEINAKLREVAGLWNEVRPYLESAVAGKAIDPEALTVVSDLNDRLFVASTQAVSLYEAL